MALDMNNFSTDMTEKEAVYSEKKLRIGIIGTGGIAHSHIRAYQHQPDVEIVAACDLIPGKAEKFLKEYNVEAPTFEDYKQMIDTVPMDAVSVCVYNRNHAVCTIYALEHGLNVLLEKPMTVTLDEAVEIANFFLPRGKTLVTTKGKTKQASNTYKTLREPLDLEIPLAVLVNSATASASEILSGSLQDLDRAVIVGNRTFGKGLVQVPRSLPYGGTMKVTTSKYYIPSGRCVQAIDYKHRNEDGSVGRIPDSLTTVFYTAAGREVRDGGGVMPDITIKQEKLPNILFYLVRDNLIFDYATQYCLKHPTIVAPEKFEVTDADYNDFKALVKKADFKYDQQSEKILKTLKEAAEFEGYMDGAKEEFAALETKLTHNLDHELDRFSKEIKDAIAQEILKRYYFQRGAILQRLKDDPDLKKAIETLNNQSEYSKILSVMK